MLDVGITLDGKYVIRKLINHGGFGRVWEAYDSILDKSVAIKELINLSIEQQESFLAEIQTLASLEHQNIVRIYHAVRHDGYLYLIMEMCHEGSLADILDDRGSIPEHEVVEIVLAICSGLEVVHRNGIVHHDIKPANILVGNDENYKISDFGVANTTCGTIAYLAPEQFEPHSDPLDVRIDVYALGITLYEMITGDVPFRGSRAQIIYGHASVYPTFPPEVPEWLSEIILKAIAKEPDLRFQTAEEFRIALINKHTPPLLRTEMITASIWNADAEVLMAKSKWGKALRRLEEGLRLYPDYPVARANLGLCYFNIGRSEKALEHFEKANYLQNPSVIKTHATLLIDQGDYGRAISMLSDYLYKHPLDFEGHNILGWAMYESGNIDRAAAILDTLLARKSDNPSFINNSMICRYLLNREYTCPSEKFDIAEYNLSVMHEQEQSWAGVNRNEAKGKLLYADYQETLESSPVGLVKINQLSLGKSIVALGRLSVNDYVVDAPSVSRRHCVIICGRKRWEIVDLESTWGTYLNDQRIRGRRSIASGVYSLKLSDTELHLELIESQ